MPFKSNRKHLVVGLLTALMAIPPAHADRYISENTINMIGSCPSYAGGIEVGGAYAESVGISKLAGDVPDPALDVQSRISRSNTQEMAVYVNILNRNFWNDKLVGAASPLAKEAQLKEYRRGSVLSDAAVDADEAMKTAVLSPVDEIIVPAARETTEPVDVLDGSKPYYMVELKPRSKFIHLKGMKPPFYFGQTIPLELHFEKAGKITVDAQFRPRDKKRFPNFPWPDCANG